MPVKWKSARYPGVRFYEHESRRHGVIPDRYFAIRFQAGGKRREEGLGWASQGWSEKKAADELAKLREAARTGEGSASLAEKRKLAETKRQAQEARRQQEEIEGITFGAFWRDTYFPQAQRDKTTRTWKREQSFYNKWLGPALAKAPLKSISLIHLERVKSNMSKAGLSPRSIAYCLDVVRQVFHRAISLGTYHGSPPTTQVKKPRADNKRLWFLNRTENEHWLPPICSAEYCYLAVVILHLSVQNPNLKSGPL